MDRLWQRQMDFRMLGILKVGESTYQVGPWKLLGPAMEVVRSTPFLRRALVISNPSANPMVKRYLLEELNK